MRLAEAAERVFARHETFHPRYGWFRKAYAFVGNDPRIFTRQDAPVRMGVGKNMVRGDSVLGDGGEVDRGKSRLANTSFGQHGADSLG